VCEPPGTAHPLGESSRNQFAQRGIFLPQRWGCRLSRWPRVDHELAGCEQFSHMPRKLAVFNPRKGPAGAARPGKIQKDEGISEISPNR